MRDKKVKKSSRMIVVRVCFFFSSRRRHTRSLCDWSSDVCSSDLETLVSVSQTPHTVKQ